jgi:TPR repeat protein
MRKSGVIGCANLGSVNLGGLISAVVVAVSLFGASGAIAGPFEDGMAAYNRGDYLPAIRLFRPLAEQGNAKAQRLIGAMYHKGEGVPRSAHGALMWFSLAANRGDARAKAGMREVSKAMTPAEISQAEGMAQACAASDYRDCEY